MKIELFLIKIIINFATSNLRFTRRREEEVLVGEEVIEEGYDVHEGDLHVREKTLCVREMKLLRHLQFRLIEKQCM